MQESVEDPVVLNIYQLETAPDTDANAEQQQSSVGRSVTSFFSRILPRAGLGAYHTSLDVNGYCYTFGVGGISKSTITNKSTHVPTNGTFQESIILGSLSDDIVNGGGSGGNIGTISSRINECIKRLRESTFTPTSYHLLNRNCNHFTETLAMALMTNYRDLVMSEKSEATISSFDAYPRYINRLARSGTAVMNHGDVCDVRKEARTAAGLDGKLSWDFTDRDTDTNTGDGRTLSSKFMSKKNEKAKTQKKELTEKQKKLLAKLGKKK